MSSPTLAIISHTPLSSYWAKGEVKPRYYNPGDLFEAVHFFSLAEDDPDAKRTQEAMGSAKLEVHTLGMPKVGSLGTIRRRAVELIRKIRPSVIRTFDPVLAGYLATTAGLALGIPTVISLHGDYRETRWFGLRYRTSSLGRQLRLCAASLLLERFALRRASHVVCVSHFLTDYARRCGARSIEVIYNRVDCDSFSAPPRPHLTDGLLALTVGRVGRQKNQACLLKAVSVVEGMKLRIVGGPDGERWLYDEVLSLANELDLGERVEFIDRTTYKDMPRHFAEADIFAIATRWEGFCIPVLEAMASSLPVVIPNKAPLPEVAGDGACIVPENNPDEFAKALRRLAADPALRQDLGRKGRLRAESLDGEISERKEQAMYERLLGGG